MFSSLNTNEVFKSHNHYGNNIRQDGKTTLVKLNEFCL
jgi:hypothetical protein